MKYQSVPPKLGNWSSSTLFTVPGVNSKLLAFTNSIGHFYLCTAYNFFFVIDPETYY